MQKVTKVYIEGIDKSGKDTIVPYLNELTNYRYFVCSRSLISVMAYNELYGRATYEENLERYDLSHESDALYVMIHVDEDDWRIRCKISNEPRIDYLSNKEAMMKYYYLMRDFSNCLLVSSSTHTPMEVAKIIADWLKWKEESDK